MATIPNQATGLRHVRKTITFDGSANNGNLGDEVTLFTATGRNLVERIAAYVTSAMTCSAPAATGLQIDAAGNSAGYILSLSNINGPDAGGQWLDANESGNGYAMSAIPSGGGPVAITGNVVMLVADFGGGADITAGTIVVDCWYRPITDDGELVGDDADTELVAAVNAQVVDALATDTYAEPGSVPAATSSLKDKINWLFALARNKVTQTSTTQTLRNDADSGNIATSSVSDDGSTFTRGEWS